MIKYLWKWLIMAVAVLITAYLLPGVNVVGLWAAFVVAVVLSVANTFLKPILIILTLPVNILSLGLFTLVINAFIVMLTAYLVPGFSVASFLSAVLFSIVLSMISFVFSVIK